ncbi:DUF255 domain-containing protein [Shewanella aestuarii]|uniref:DUF255 domain-containing protein n=1 Tax=Shewanella aestuarii TaxID=1028752 RepID=A0A6G9QKX6_9GAMM|nr:DUF255 domain-containing protein [Shewanella aestuarii]QIR15122.1 DUF255 domain-containing protein [Shewanella aestuarii]
MRTIIIFFALLIFNGSVVNALPSSFKVIDEKRLNAFESQRDWLIQQQVVSENIIEPEYINSLIFATSPYLISHALQPIDWQEWQHQYQDGSGTDKLLFISIGYSTCHWCHVMAQESFSDPEIGKLLNADYVSVKVDREQWPLVDNRFKSALEILKGDAGWPINVILTPNGQLIWIDSYLSKQEFAKVLSGFAKRWKIKPKAIEALANQIEQKLLLDSAPISSLKHKPLPRSTWDALLPELQTEIKQTLIKEQTATGPRFFRAYWVLGLLDEYLRTDDSSLLDAVQQHVDDILLSPTYDAIEGGFHRYAVDGKWQIPHYEKMLYTQANMIQVLVKLYAITKEQRYLVTIEQTHKWVNDWLTQQQGIGSAVSAMSGGVEGGYYQLDDRHSELVDFNLDWTKSSIVKQAFQNRKKLTKPLVDEKVLLNWNSLYVVSLLASYSVTNDERYLLQSNQILDGLWHTFVIDNRVYRSAFNKRVSIDAEAEDLAWFAVANLMRSFYEPWLHSETKDLVNNKAVSGLEQSIWLLDKLIEKLTDMNELDKVLKLNRDGELPSTRGVVFAALSLGYDVTGNRKYLEFANRLNHLDDTKINSLINEYTFAAVQAKRTKNIETNHALFAKGNGKVSARLTNGKVELIFSMRPGWHINANEVSNQKLIPTVVKFQNVEADITYPPMIEKKLGFNNSVLELYEGDFRVLLQANIPDTDGRKVIINTQACSNKLCLLPESLTIFLSEG